MLWDVDRFQRIRDFYRIFVYPDDRHKGVEFEVHIRPDRSLPEGSPSYHLHVATIATLGELATTLGVTGVSRQVAGSGFEPVFEVVPCTVPAILDYLMQHDRFRQGLTLICEHVTPDEVARRIAVGTRIEGVARIGEQVAEP
jgi:hypothetical protein